MKRIFFITILFFTAGIFSCSKAKFEEYYVNPSTTSSTTVEMQYGGVLSSNLDYVMYKYWNYFVVLQNTALPWSQSVGIVNNPGRFVPGAAAITARWQNYYKFLAQYKELLNQYSKLPTDKQLEKRIYILTATIYVYDHTQKMVDLHGDIPFSTAGLLSTNSGDYQVSYASYDAAESIYTKMLDDLKSFADELNTIDVPNSVMEVFKTQDFINDGSITAWKKYCNSLRLRMLTRVSAASAFQSRSGSEIASIVADPSKYPLIETNDENISIKVRNVSGGINNGTNTGSGADFYQGLIGWGGGDIPSKSIVDSMLHNNDPRLKAMFQPGTDANGNYLGLDPSLNSSDQNTLVNGGTLSRYNFSTISRNTKMPGMLMNAAEVSFLLAEYYLNAGNDASAKSAYEKGISQSIDYYYWLNSISDDKSQGNLTPVTDNQKVTYMGSAGINWDAATTKLEKLNRIAVQKWTNYSVLQPIESWTEIRRLNLPAVTFVADNTNAQKTPPDRWVYPTDESSYNTANYEAVKSKDNLTTKIFWDVN